MLIMQIGCVVDERFGIARRVMRLRRRRVPTMQERKWITVLIPAVLLFGITSFASPADAGSAKVEICHFPPGNPPVPTSAETLLG